MTRQWVVTFLFFLFITGPAQAELAGEYRVDVNDIINVSLLQPDPLNVELTVSPDGSVTFPYVGTVPVKGLTLSEVQTKIQTGLQDYMKYPLVAVSLKESRSRQFFVYGEVNRPGSYPMANEATVLQAITTAGGFTRIASTSNVSVLRTNADGTVQTFSVNTDQAMRGKKNADKSLQPGDVITVSQRFF